MKRRAGDGSGHPCADGVAVIGGDFDQVAVRELQGRGLHELFGDGEDPDFLEMLPIFERGRTQSMWPLRASISTG